MDRSIEYIKNWEKSRVSAQILFASWNQACNKITKSLVNKLAQRNLFRTYQSHREVHRALKVIFSFVPGGKLLAFAFARFKPVVRHLRYPTAVRCNSWNRKYQHRKSEVACAIFPLEFIVMVTQPGSRLAWSFRAEFPISVSNGELFPAATPWIYDL